jgi:hypothetical protein
MDPADHQLVAQLQTLQRVVAFQQLVRAALINTDDVGDSLETHSFTNRNWENRVEQARLTFRDLDSYCQRQIAQIMENIHDLFHQRQQ